jgi:hypothetical protein
MAKQLQLRKGTATEHDTFTGANGEVTVDTTNKTFRVHDGSTVGGTRLATLTSGVVPPAQLPSATTSAQGAVILNNTLTSTNTNQALTAAQGKVLQDQAFGVGQTLTDVTASRAINTVYTNTTGKPIFVAIGKTNQTSDMRLNVNGVQFGYASGSNEDSQSITLYAIVPSGATYGTVGLSGFVFWSELR